MAHKLNLAGKCPMPACASAPILLLHYYDKHERGAYQPCGGGAGQKTARARCGASPLPHPALLGSRLAGQMPPDRGPTADHTKVLSSRARSNSKATVHNCTRLHNGYLPLATPGGDINPRSEAPSQLSDHAPSTSKHLSLQTHLEPWSLTPFRSLPGVPLPSALPAAPSLPVLLSQSQPRTQGRTPKTVASWYRSCRPQPPCLAAFTLSPTARHGGVGKSGE